MDNDDSRAFSA